jgi:hypothetical protein
MNGNITNLNVHVYSCRDGSKICGIPVCSDNPSNISIAMPAIINPDGHLEILDPDMVMDIQHDFIAMSCSASSETEYQYILALDEF